MRKRRYTQARSQPQTPQVRKEAGQQRQQARQSPQKYAQQHELQQAQQREQQQAREQPEAHAAVGGSTAEPPAVTAPSADPGVVVTLCVEEQHEEGERRGEGPRNEEGPRQLDVRELSWEERERVLRLLFARITAHMQVPKDGGEGGGGVRGGSGGGGGGGDGAGGVDGGGE
jgi:hypothetical protein